MDIGKTHHHAVVINAEGERLLSSRRIQNDETELLALLGDVSAISDDVLWAVDLNHGGAALRIGLPQRFLFPLTIGFEMRHASGCVVLE